MVGCNDATFWLGYAGLPDQDARKRLVQMAGVVRVDKIVPGAAWDMPRVILGRK